MKNCLCVGWNMTLFSFRINLNHKAIQETAPSVEFINLIGLTSVSNVRGTDADSKNLQWEKLEIAGPMQNFY